MSATRRLKRFGLVLFTFVLLFSGFAGLIKPATAQTTVLDPEYYCDYRNLPSGSVAQWWANAGGTADCIDLTVINSPASCSLDATFYSHVVLKDGRKVDALTWYELTGPGGTVVQYSQVFPVTFPEDYNGGSVTILINFNSPESDIGVGLSDYDKAHWRTTSRGVEYTLNTDCQQPPTEVLWCSPGYWKNHKAAWPVDLNTPYADIFLTPAVDKKGNVVANATLFDVISKPQVFGGPATEAVASYLSSLMGPGWSNTVPDGSLPVRCPLN